MGKRGVVEAGESGKEGRGGILNTLNPIDEEERNKGFSLSLKVKVAQSYATSRPHGLYSPWNSPGQNTGVGGHFLFQEIFPTQGSNPGLPHCRWILYQLNHQGSPRILERVAHPFPRGSSLAGASWAHQSGSSWKQFVRGIGEPFQVFL